ncbi:permease of the major facilitator superfamily [Candidatus Scalindua japonica]|uniref:Permease of the major facilitator superfamily n=1 Tax=Candidatus Scalindua japonica TaxID=1284222 RepID=A0A286TTZ2_9BACT|nr:hypothetical protein [Candidatus Scalindua japonica]GAX59338.1 permease of the major facilitator superfamily [Candidatus Scalindua japonica]
MTKSKFLTSPDKYVLDAMSDIPDIRDRMYEPMLVQLKKKIDPPDNLFILDQGRERCLYWIRSCCCHKSFEFA